MKFIRQIPTFRKFEKVSNSLFQHLFFEAESFTNRSGVSTGKYKLSDVAS